ncbi:MAG: CvpA family protein [Flavobacteriaceae bacterium]
MNVLDIILGSLILLGLIRGLMRGLFVELASITALIVGIYGAIHFSDYAAAFLENRVSWEEKYINITAFAITFVILVLAIALAGKALTKIADFAALGILNKLLGAIFGALKAGFILSVILIILTKTNKTIPFLDDDTLETSVLYAPVKSLVPMVFPSIEDIKQEIEEDDRV